MRALDRPEISHRTLFENCVQQTQSEASRAILQGLGAKIVEAGLNFVAAAQAANVSTVTPVNFTEAESALVKPLYEHRLVSKRGVGRWAYDKIRNSSPRCPYCSFGEVYEVDHFLSKSDFPELNICPSNLVPICHPCNHIKLDRRPATAHECLLHPYFDVLPNLRWLFAELQFSDNGPKFSYRVFLNPGEHPILAERLRFHFETFQLSRRFREQAALTLVDIENDLADLFPSLGPQGLKAHLESESKRHLQRHGNCLESAAYLAASENADFCNGRYSN
jgi:hypothetical protein